MQMFRLIALTSFVCPCCVCACVRRYSPYTRVGAETGVAWSGGRHPKWSDAQRNTHALEYTGTDKLRLRVEAWDRDTIGDDGFIGIGDLDVSHVIGTQSEGVSIVAQLRDETRRCGFVILYVA